jgi:lipopolysaccharide transport system permease protein
MVKNTAESVIKIRAERGWAPLNLKDLWNYRELLYFLTWRQIKVRYKQTALGFLWAIIQPFTMMVVFSIFFGNLLNAPSDGIPYPLFSFAGLLPWNLFAQGLSLSSNSLVADSNLIKKVYFPRLVMPLSGILPPLVDFLFAFLVLIAMMIYYSQGISIRILALPAFIILPMLTATGVGLWLSALNAKYRDIQYTVPFLIQLWLFASPVAYASSILPQGYQVLYGINPMSGVIEGFRWALLGTEPPGYLLLVSAAIVIIILVTGFYFYKRSEKSFVDVL